MAESQQLRVRFRNDLERDLFKIAELGENIRTFLLTNSIGQHLHRRAKQEILQAEADALAVDVDGWRGWFFARAKLRAIRRRADVARAFIQWLGEAMVEGDSAAKALEEMEEQSE